MPCLPDNEVFEVELSNTKSETYAFKALPAHSLLKVVNDTKNMKTRSKGAFFFILFLRFLPLFQLHLQKRISTT
jgi:hypothetical protein